MKHTTRRLLRCAGAAALACAAILTATACDARERAAERRSGEQAAVQDESSSTGAPDANEVVSDAQLDEIDALLDEIDADLAQADRDAATSEGDVE